MSLDRSTPPAPAPTSPLAAPPQRPRPGAPGRSLPAPTVRTPGPPRRSLRLRHAVLAALVVGALVCVAPERREGAPAPVQIAIGPAWTALALAPFRGTRQLHVTGDGAFSLRIDGARVVRVAPGDGITVGPPYLHSLELRAARPSSITLTPQGD